MEHVTGDEIDRETILDLILSNGHQGVWFIDKDSQTIFANRRMAEMLGTDLDTLLSSSMYDFMDEEQKVAASSNVERRKEGVSEVHEFCFRRMDGTQFWASLATGPIPELQDEYEGAFALVTDITDRILSEKILKTRTELFEQFASAVHDVLWIIEPTPLEVVYVSPAYKHVWGRSSEDLLRSKDWWLSSIHEEDREDVNASFQLLMQGKSEKFSASYRIVRPNGEIRWIRDHAWAVRSSAGELKSVAGIAVDVSKEVEEQERAIQVREMMAALAGSAQKALVTLSHEIRSPLKSFLTVVELLEETALNEEQRKYLSWMRPAAEQMNSLVETSLTLAREQRDPWELNQSFFELAAQCQECIRMLAGRAYSKGLQMACQIDAHAPDKVYGDPVRLRQVLVNLLGNALKYTSTGSVSLQVMSSEPVDRRAGGVRVKFKVVDTGPGIPQELHKSIFEEFETGVDSVGGSRESTGLGLAISRKLLDRMGGCLSLESEEGLGTTFTAEIPFPHKES